MATTGFRNYHNGHLVAYSDGTQARVFGKTFADIYELQRFIYIEIHDLVYSSLKLKAPIIPLSKNKEIQYIIREISDKIYEEIEEKYYLKEPNYNEDIMTREYVPVSEIANEALFRKLFEWATQNRSEYLKYPTFQDFLYNNYVHNILMRYENIIIAFISKKDLPLYHKVLEDLNYKINIDIDFSNPLMISYDILGVMIPEEHLNFMKLCMPGSVIDTLDSDLLKTIGSIVFFERTKNNKPPEFVPLYF